MSVIGSCSRDTRTQGSVPACITIRTAQVCGTVDEGRLVMTAEGLEPGSTLRVDVEGMGPAEWRVSEAGTLAGTPGQLGFLTYTGAIGTLTIEATADDGALLTGEVILD